MTGDRTAVTGRELSSTRYTRAVIEAPQCAPFRLHHAAAVRQREERSAAEPADAIVDPGQPLRVLMLSWEYPPVVVGGLGRHVHALATALAAAGHEVTVVTRHAEGAPLEEYVEGVRVVRAPEDPPLFPLHHRDAAGLDDGVQPRADPGRAARRRRPPGSTWSTPTTGWSRTPPSR